MTSAADHIIIKGAREHNLKNIDLEIPKNKFVVFTGVSGSGKSSLALDTIYAEGQRRYVESLSAYARQFLGVMGKPDVDSIEGLSPSIAIDQKSASKNPRSTVGTITEVYDFLRLLFARIGHPHCPECGREISRQSSQQIVNNIFDLVRCERSFKTKRGVRLMILSPIVRDRKGEYSALFENLKKQGVTKARIDGAIRNLNEDFALIKTNKHTIDAVLSRLIINREKLKDPKEKKDLKSNVYQTVETALNLSGGNVSSFGCAGMAASSAQARTGAAAVPIASWIQSRRLIARLPVFLRVFLCSVFPRPVFLRMAGSLPASRLSGSRSPRCGLRTGSICAPRGGRLRPSRPECGRRTC